MTEWGGSLWDMSLVSNSALKVLDIQNSSFLYGQRSNHASSLVGRAEICVLASYVERVAPRFTLANETRIPLRGSVWQHCMLRPLRRRWVAGRGVDHGPCIPPGHGLSRTDREVGGRKLHLIVHLDYRIPVSGFARAAIAACLQHGQNTETQHGEPSTA